MSSDRELSTDDLAARQTSDDVPEAEDPERLAPGAGSAGPEAAIADATEPQDDRYPTAAEAGSSAAALRAGNATRPPEDDSAQDPSMAPLLSPEDAQIYRDQWTSVQGQFVDQPRDAVREADRLVADLMQRLAGQFSQTRQRLEQQWDGDENVSTEDLRVAMTRYRSFFERLLAA
ncbi:MAG TPA: hypothetical protein VFA05_09260 [Gaiellaceae bacterium]|nr:hypothetical protein [Gaiellaceae bacterium]